MYYLSYRILCKSKDYQNGYFQHKKLQYSARILAQHQIVFFGALPLSRKQNHSPIMFANTADLQGRTLQRPYGLIQSPLYDN